MLSVQGGHATRTIVAATKLAIPRTRQTLVARPELAARLDEPYRFGLVSAPAGYGKTATISAWAAMQPPEEVAWLSCDAIDAEPTRFMSALLAAISMRWPGVADDAFVLLERGGANTYDSAVAVANELAVSVARGTIVVDDLHLANPAPEMLTAFIDALPPGFRFVAGSRTTPPLSLSRWRLRGELLELRGDDLRFGSEELAEFFALQNLETNRSDNQRLHELTEGWPAGVQMTAIALRRGIDPGDFVGAFAATDRAVSDFLLSEVLSSLPPDVVEFLVETSVLEIFDAQLCEAVTGRDDAAAVIEHLTNANLFVVELDDPARWFRYHHLFGAFLRARLRSLGGRRVRAAHERASHALEARGFVDGALRQAIETGDVERISQIMRGLINRTMSAPANGITDMVRAVRLWLHECGSASIETDPGLVLELLISLIVVSHSEDTTTWLDRVQRAYPDADGPLTALIEATRSTQFANQGQALAAIDSLDRALEAVGGNPPNTGLVRLLFVANTRGNIQAGQMDQARSILQRADAHRVGHPVVDDVRTPGLAAFVAAWDGELSTASTLARNARTSADLLGLGRNELGLIYAGLAMVQVALERDERETARELIDDIQNAADESHQTQMQADVALQHARLARCLGDEALASRQLDRVRLAYAKPDAAVLQVVGEEAVAQALRFEPAATEALIAGLDAGRVGTRVALARLAILENDEGRAAHLLTDLPPPTTRRERVERGVLDALSVMSHDVPAAHTHLAQALAHGRQEWMIRTIVDQSPDVYKLLVSFSPPSELVDYVDTLLSASGRGVGPLRAKVKVSLVVPLSPREITVLRYLCSRLTYQEIAAALYVSLNTLKSHVRTVYRKLGVASRSEAVQVGRAAGLI